MAASPFNRSKILNKHLEDESLLRVTMKERDIGRSGNYGSIPDRQICTYEL